MKIDSKLDLVLERVIPVKRQDVWDAWTKPELLMQWFCPAPWKTVDCRMELVPGGEFYTHMKGPNAGEEHKSSGCVLEVVPGKKFVFTDCFSPGYRPSANPFMTGILILEDHPEGTKYTAIARHKDEAAVKQHKEMGFEQGWGAALDQMVAMIKKSS